MKLNLRLERVILNCGKSLIVNIGKCSLNYEVKHEEAYYVPTNLLSNVWGISFSVRNAFMYKIGKLPRFQGKY